MDGTLTRTNRLIYDSFNHIAEKYRGRRYTDAEISTMFGPPEEEALRAIVPTEDMDEVMKDYLHFYRTQHATLASLYPGMESLLRRLKELGVLVALFTGKGRQTTEISLNECNIGKYFDVLVTGSDVDRYKPSGEGIRKILQRFQLLPAEALMVGDSIADVISAREAGVQVASVVWDSYGNAAVLELKPDFIFHSVEELSSFFLSTLTAGSPQSAALQ